MNNENITRGFLHLCEPEHKLNLNIIILNRFSKVIMLLPKKSPHPWKVQLKLDSVVYLLKHLFYISNNDESF